MLTLYDYLDSGNGYKCRLLLAQLGIAYERVEIDIDKGETRRAEFLAKNPNGRIPTLKLEDGTYLAESNAILCYLADGTKATGWPTWFTDLATQLEFNVKASQAFAYRWMGYAQPTALSASNQTNFLTQRFPTLLRSACLMIACEFERMWEDRDKYRAEAEYWLGEAQAANGLARNHMHRVPVVR